MALNYLKRFPNFCVNDNTECNLIHLNFASNNLKSISNQNLIGLINLEYLNLEQNDISTITKKINLQKMNQERIVNLNVQIVQRQ